MSHGWVRSRGGAQRQPQTERRALTGFAPDADVTAVACCHVLDDREAETGSAGVARPGRIHPVEALEDAIELVLRDADSLVADHDHCVRTFQVVMPVGAGTLDDHGYS